MPPAIAGQGGHINCLNRLLNPAGSFEAFDSNIPTACGAGEVVADQLGGSFVRNRLPLEVALELCAIYLQRAAYSAYRQSRLRFSAVLLAIDTLSPLHGSAEHTHLWRLSNLTVALHLAELLAKT